MCTSLMFRSKTLKTMRLLKFGPALCTVSKFFTTSTGNLVRIFYFFSLHREFMLD